MELRFNDPDEFLAELRQAPPDAEPVLRLTVRRRLDPHTGAFAHVSVVAGYLRLLPAGSEPLAMPVILEAYQGQDWGAGFEQTRKTLQRAQDLLVRLQSQARDLGLECRPGTYERRPRVLHGT